MCVIQGIYKHDDSHTLHWFSFIVVEAVLNEYVEVSQTAPDYDPVLLRIRNVGKRIR